MCTINTCLSSSSPFKIHTYLVSIFFKNTPLSLYLIIFKIPTLFSRGGLCTDAFKMGKINQQQLPLHQQQIDGVGSSPNHSGICFSMGGVSKMCKVCNFRCFVVVILSVSVFLSAICWGLPHHPNISCFDAKSAIKNSGMVCFI